MTGPLPRNTLLCNTYISSWRIGKVALEDSRETATTHGVIACPPHKTRANQGLGPLYPEGQLRWELPEN